MNNQQISRIDINGFKSIKHCSLELGMINVLIGSNGAGKSNFISAFKFLQEIIDKNLQLFISTSGGPNSMLFNGAKYTDAMSVEFFFGLNSYGFKLVPTDDNRLTFAKEFFGYYSNGSYHGYLDSAGSGESAWDKGLHNGIDKYVSAIFKTKKWRVYHFHDTSKAAKVKQMHKVANNAELLFDAGNLAAFLLRLKENYAQSYENIRYAVKSIAPYFEDFYLVPNDNNEDISLRWRQKGCDDIFNANQFSDGTLRFACIATLLLQPKELQPETIIIDEPELGLHPYAINILAEMVKSISDNKQIILSTQSVELLNEFDIDHIVVVDRTEDGTVFKRLSEDELSEWLQSDYSLGDLWKKNLIGGRFG